MLTSTSETPDNRGHVRFLLDGALKTISHPYTGAALHAIAGNPASLTSRGREVPNDFEPFDLQQDQEFTSKFARPVPGAAAPVPAPHPEQKG